LSEPLPNVSQGGPDDDPRHVRAEERRRLHARRENALRSLLELGGELSVSLDLYETVDLLLFNLMGQLSTARSAIWLVPEEEAGRSVLVRSHGFHRPTIEAIGASTGWLREQFRDDPSTVLAWALRERVGAAEFELMRHAEIALFASLHTGREQLGWLAIGPRVDGSPYTPEDLQTLEATLGIAAVSMHSARLYNRAREANRQLRATNDHLSELDRLKTEFLSNVNHELRTPLAIVLASLDLAVSEGASGPQLQALLAGSLHQSKKLHALIENLLTFADIQNARLALEVIADDPTGVLEQCLAERLPGVTEGLRELSLKRGTSVLRARFDRQRVLQIVNELIDNAVKFTPRGSHIMLRVDGCTDEGAEWVKIEVADDGPGISPERKGSLFRSFEQGDGSSTRVAGGLGMGLAFARTLAERMGGRLTADSQPGKGCTFRLLLPVDPAPHS
jgi:signal transduction histidine kinase